jgi:uncharacterized protein YecT (DUF1311 family)
MILAQLAVRNLLAKKGIGLDKGRIVLFTLSKIRSYNGLGCKNKVIENNMKRFYVLMFMLMFTSSMSFAAGGDVANTTDYVQIHKPYMSLTCVDAQTQADMDTCSKRSLENSIKQMNRLLDMLHMNHSKSEPELLTILEKSQTDWKAYMESTCRVETYYSRGGTGFDSIWNACLEAKINERASLLQWMLDNP